MRNYVWIGCGSVAGAILRYLLENARLSWYHGSIPLNTLLINLSGAFLMGFLMTALLEVLTVSPALRLALTTGLLGAYTTFSTMCKESSVLLLRGDLLSGLCYPALSVLLGLGAVLLGTAAARKLGTALLQRGNSLPDGKEEPEAE